ncbi:MAG: phosphatidylglycerophosphatase A [Endomicrobium sp.]|jgi:phosphatidylglycerophosphatase A|nr:phosphatidylglycerophosphatase A [Endomicrobium sp.]
MNKIIIFFSSVFFTGYSKLAPGTLGSLIGLIVWLLVVPNKNYVLHIFLLIFVSIVSIFFSSIAENIYNKKDDQKIVIDEFVGSWFSFAFLPKNLPILIFSFLLFRIFDIKKPLFIAKLQNLRGGFGITLDDIAAGVFSNIILQIVVLLWWL